MTDRNEGHTAPEVLDALSQNIESIGIPIAILTVVKYVDREHGEQGIAILADSATTPVWDHLGMLEYAKTTLLTEVASDPFDV